MEIIDDLKAELKKEIDSLNSRIAMLHQKVDSFGGVLEREAQSRKTWGVDFLKALDRQKQELPKSIETKQTYAFDVGLKVLLYSVIFSVLLTVLAMWYFQRDWSMGREKNQEEKIKYLENEVSYFRQKDPKAAKQFDKQNDK